MAYETCINTIDRHQIGATCFAHIRNGPSTTTNPRHFDALLSYSLTICSGNHSKSSAI